MDMEMTVTSGAAALCMSCGGEVYQMSDAGFQTDDSSDLNNTEITKCWLTRKQLLFSGGHSC